MRAIIVFIALAAGAVQMAGAQSVSVDHLTQNDILEKAQALEPKAKGAEG
jgi:hypothetical protein